MPKSHLAPERPTTAERDASAARSVLPMGAESSGRFAIWYVVRIDGNSVLARFPYPMRADAERYSETVGGCYVVQGRASGIPNPRSNPAPVATRVRSAPATLRVWEDGTERQIPHTDRQDAINDANKMVEAILDRRGGVLTVEAGVKIIRRRNSYTIIDVSERNSVAPAPQPLSAEYLPAVPCILTQRYRGVHFKTRVQTWEEEPTETPYADRGFALAVAEQLARGCMERTGGKMSHKYDTWTVEYGYMGDTIYTVSVS
ncbi:MAG: hypothetical protein E6R03_18325 [Hyphomicrobiaceae bacterium]|nr:MAG: hypothetical protein E6R03_18325 [Hyphomicrobiaceae bacterium]